MYPPPYLTTPDQTIPCRTKPHHTIPNLALTTKVLTLHNLGQSLVEFAIIAPVLLIMLLGLLEVGWMLRAYLVLDNVSREAARFATKVSTLDLEKQTAVEIGFPDVVTHSNAALAQQLPLYYGKTGWIVISVVAIKVSWPCDPQEREVEAKLIGGGSVITSIEHIGGLKSPTYTIESMWSNCNCMQAGFKPFTPTVVMQPVTHPYLQYAVPATQTSRIDYKAFVDELQTSTERTDCIAMKTSDLTTPSNNVAVIVELGYDHRQLVKFFPGVDPIELYSRTIMRKNISREEE